MTKFSQISFVAVVLFIGTITASAQSSQSCKAFIDQMAENVLYSASCFDRDNCLERVVEIGGNSLLQGRDGTTRLLQKGQRYNFIYKIPQSGMPSSLVVVQVRQLDVTARTGSEASRVRMLRYPIAFACFRRRQDVSLPQWPHLEVRGRDLPSVAYNRYDEFHRNGFTTADEDRLIRSNFHVRYFNGQTCVSTLDPIRRAQFLMHDQNNYSGRVGTFFLSLGLHSTTASAEELNKILQYKRLKVVVSNYQRASNSPGCFAFSTKAGRPESLRLDIVIRDIERQVEAYPFDLSRNWSFELQ